MKQIPLPIGLTAARSFENFLPGANAAVLAQLGALRPGATPVYLWGPSGAGKTHLLQALLLRLHDEGVPSAGFGAGDRAPWTYDERWGVIVVDDCERLDAGQQHGAFSIYVHAAAHGATLVAAGRLPPVDMPVREDLRSRFGWGHVLALHPLSEPQVRAALRREADRRGIMLSDDVIEYLLTHFARDLKCLLDLLDRLDEFSLAQKRNVTVPLLRQMLAQEDCA
jgi:DnaA-homolog protein